MSPALTDLVAPDVVQGLAVMRARNYYRDLAADLAEALADLVADPTDTGARRRAADLVALAYGPTDPDGGAA